MSETTRHPWSIAVRCAQCQHSAPEKPSRFHCINPLSPAYLQTTWSDFGCVCGSPMLGAGTGLLPILNAEKERVVSAMMGYIPTHGEDLAELSRKANKRTYMAQEFYEVRPPTPDYSPDYTGGCGMACAEDGQ